MPPRFFVGNHQPSDVKHLDQACISINRLRGRKKAIRQPPIQIGDIIDSGAYSELAEYGEYRHPPAAHAAELRRLHETGVVRIEIAVAQDYM